jgi:hypothetical protein
MPPKQKIYNKPIIPFANFLSFSSVYGSYTKGLPKSHACLYDVVEATIAVELRIFTHPNHTAHTANFSFQTSLSC